MQINLDRSFSFNIIGHKNDDELFPFAMGEMIKTMAKNLQAWGIPTIS